jgi:hypothetical protein
VQCSKGRADSANMVHCYVAWEKGLPSPVPGAGVSSVLLNDGGYGW